jgi:hypothetical protein
MRVHVPNLMTALFTDLKRREETRLLIERMEHDPHALQDIGLTLEQFAALQWKALKDQSATRLALGRLAEWTWRLPRQILSARFFLYRTPSAKL